VHVYAQAIIDAVVLFFSGGGEIWPVIRLSLAVSGSATLIAAAIGLPIGYFLGTSRFAVRGTLILLVNTAMGFPPVVIGLFVYMALSRTGPLGDLGLLFTPPAMVIAQVILATPIVAGVATAAIASVPRDLRIQVRALGASRLQESLAVFKEGRRGVMAAVIAGFGSVISEVGAVSMVGGNIQGSTRVMTTAIVFYVGRGEFGLAMAWGMVLLGIALVATAALTMVQQRGNRYER
jgi:tungstate transport system permease protein